MGEAERQVGPPVDGPANGGRTPEDIERDIERTREELGDTVAALAAKTDVKARVHEKVDETKVKVSEKAPPNVALIVGGVGIAAVVLVAIVAKRRRA